MNNLENNCLYHCVLLLYSNISNQFLYLIGPAVLAVLVLGLDVEDVLHVELEGLVASGPDHPGPLVHLEPAASYKKRNTDRMIKTSAPIGAWRCNFPPFPPF